MQKIIEKQISIFCQSCKIEVQREQNGFDHYRTDWHCYNVKLKCSAKPPLTLQQYQTFVLVDTNVKKTFKCNDCKKNFKSENAFKEHKLTRKHLKKLKSVCGNSGKKRNFVDSEFQCLFCQNGFDKQEKLDLHFNEHGFFIPYKESLKSLKNFLVFLREKIKIGQCIYCDRKFVVKEKFNPAQFHMIDKNHCKLKEVKNQFFVEYKDFYHFDQNALQNIAKTLFRKQEIDMMITDGGELLLDNGTYLGHRENLIYYKQSALFLKFLQFIVERPQREDFEVEIKEKTEQNFLDKKSELRQQKNNLQLCLKANSINRKKEKKIH